MTLLRHEPPRADGIRGVVAGTSGHDRDVVPECEVLAELSQQLARRRAIGVEVLVEDEDTKPAVAHPRVTAR
jgi:hypothetical protein